MKRSCILAVVMVTAGHVVVADEVVSFSGRVDSGATETIVPEVPSEGFILTDLFIGDANSQPDFVYLTIYDFDGATDWKRIEGKFGAQRYTSLGAGIPFEHEVRAKNYAGVSVYVTLTGYIPSPSGTVPAVGELGVAVMVAAVLVVGTIVFTRMKQRQAV